MQRIYLDHNATTPVDSAVLEEMLPFFSKDFGNPSSIHAHGQRGRIALDTARERVARALGCSNYEIVFTSGGTESNNLAIAGYLGKTAEKGRHQHIITCAVEHSAVLKICQHLEKTGVSVTRIPVSHDGIINITDLKAAIREDTSLVSIMTANNETGAIQPLAEIVMVAHEKGVPVHTDAVQAFGKIPINVKELGVDMLSISGHKFYGPKGAGALYLRRGLHVEPVLRGGGQEKGMRGGTENIPALVGLGRACELAVSSLPGNFSREKSLRDRLQSLLTREIHGVRVNSDHDKRIPNTLSISFAGVEAEALAVRLDMEGLSVSTGAACSSGAAQVSHVLKAMEVPAEYLNSAIRLSMGHGNTPGEIDKAARIIVRTISELRKISRKSL